jgi:hypothetical protein
LEKLQGPELFELLIAVDEFNIQTLISYIQKYMIIHQDELLQLLQQNLIGILEVVYQHESFTDLWNYCLEKICQEPKILFESDKFTSLEAPLLKLFLEKDDLKLDQLDGIFVWDSLIKWGLAQNPFISKDITKWNKEDVTIMERTLHDFIPLVRFYHISSEEFFDKIFLLRKLLPKDLAIDLVKFHIVPNRKLNIDKIQLPRQSKCIYDSTLIKDQHFVILANWIDKKKKNIHYNFNLLYRASRDGNTPVVFHNKCDNKGATIVIAKISNSEKIVGGYNPFFWYSYGQDTSESFIYLFNDKIDIKNAKVSYSNGVKYGPRFGYGSGCQNNMWFSLSTNSYSKIDGIPTGNLNVDDYEVFQVIKE